AHELGHILLQHPRRPFRVRDTNSARPIDPRLEREANIFAREFLVPAHLARNYKTIEELKVAFQISADTAELRLKELKIQEREKLATERFKGPAHKSRRGNDRSYELDHQIAVLCTAI